METRKLLIEFAWLIAVWGCKNVAHAGQGEGNIKSSLTVTSTAFVH